MKTSLSGLILAGLLALSACSTTKTNMVFTAPSAQMPQKFHFQKTIESDVGYLLFLPQGYSEDPDKKWPLIMFLHGSGERGTNVLKVATHGPPKMATNHADLPFIIVSPQCHEGKVWSTETLIGLLDEITTTYAVDTRRVYLTGLSMGGYGTWALGMAYPERFAAIAPVCGGGDLISVILSSSDKKAALKTLGIWAFHGAKDPVVPVEESKRMVEAAKRAGVKDVKLTIYPEATHDSWTETYKNPNLYQWFLDHQRKAG